MKILLADDHKLVREGLRLPLSRLAESVEILEAERLSEAIDLAAACDDIDLVILDLGMPGMNRFAGIEAMRKTLPDTPVVILSGSIDEHDVVTSLSKGASGYIPKTLGLMAMVGALQIVLAGEKYVPSLILDGQNSNGGSTDRSALGPPFGTLTPRERDVLDHLVLGESNKEIARGLGIEEVTVKVHLVSVYRKIGVSSRTQAVKFALESGWTD